MLSRAQGYRREQKRSHKCQWHTVKAVSGQRFALAYMHARSRGLFSNSNSGRSQPQPLPPKRLMVRLTGSGLATLKTQRRQRRGLKKKKALTGAMLKHR